MPKIFISYRHQDARTEATFIHHLLSERFGADDIFFDADAIVPGENFEDRIEKQICNCDVLLAIIGEKWIDAKNDDGSLRLEEENDFVLREIALAFQREKAVIPVLVEKAEIPKEPDLPPLLKGLFRQQVQQIDPKNFTRDVGSLCDILESMPLPIAAPNRLDIIIENELRGQEIRIHEMFHSPELWEKYGIQGEYSEEDGRRLEGIYSDALFSSYEPINIADPQLNPMLRVILRLVANNMDLTDSELGSLSRVPNLESLHLQDNRIRDLASLSALGKLQRLRIGRNLITNLDPLADLGALKLLKINGNQINDLTPLAELKGLEQINLRDNTALNEDKIEKLKSELPDCTIISNCDK